MPAVVSRTVGSLGIRLDEGTSRLPLDRQNSRNARRSSSLVRGTVEGGDISRVPLLERPESGHRSPSESASELGGRRQGRLVKYSTAPSGRRSEQRQLPRRRGIPAQPPALPRDRLGLQAAQSPGA